MLLRLKKVRLCTMCTEIRGPVEDVVEVEEGPAVYYVY